MLNHNIWNFFIVCQNWIIDIRAIGLMSRVFAYGPGDLGSIPDPKTQKMVLDVALLNTQQYKVRIKGKVE